MENSNRGRSLKPTKTEYKGIRYRSKCEAMFARYLDLRTTQYSEYQQLKAIGDGLSIVCSSRGIYYEPTTHVGGWKPDFLVWNVEVPDRAEFDIAVEKCLPGLLVPRLYMEFAEYKPCLPTRVYCDRFHANAKKWTRSTTLMADFRIYFGNPYDYPNKPCGLITFDPYESRWEVDYESDWLASIASNLLSYRFDLESR